MWRAAPPSACARRAPRSTSPGLDGPALQYASLHLPIAGSAPDVVRFLARPQARTVARDALRLPAGRRRGHDRSVAGASRCSNSVTALRARHQGRRFGLEVLAEECPGRRSTSPTLPLRIKFAGPELNVTGTGKLDGNVVEIGWREMFGAKAAVPPPLRPQGHDTGRPRGQGGISPGRALRQRARRHDAALPGGDQRHERGGRPLRDQGRQGGAGAARLDQGAGHRRPGAGDAEARRRRQAHHHRFRGPRQRPFRQGPGALRRRQRRAADRAATGQDRADRRCGRLEACAGRRRALAARSLARAAARARHDEVARRDSRPRSRPGRPPRRAAAPRWPCRSSMS